MPAPINPHLTDSILSPFLSSTFSPVDFLNAHLPTPSAPEKPQQPAPSLTTLASQTQSQISTLNAQVSRLSDTLTDLTDDILRTSSRLAYEVELLRGEAFTLAETISANGDLNGAILRFLPNGISNSPNTTTHSTLSPNKIKDLPQANPSESNDIEPPSLPRLRTLHHVRQQLQSVIRIFNLALSFPLPASLLTTPTSALVSVQSPNTDPDAEPRGQAALAKLKGEVVDMLRIGDMKRAKDRVAELREVCGVWKGTSEERARLRWVEGLEQLVGQTEGASEAGSSGAREKADGQRGVVESRERSAVRGAQELASTGSGFLRRLRDEIYME